MTIKERTYAEFMKRFDRDEDLGDPYVISMKMMVSSLIAKDGFHAALDILDLGFGSENVVVYNQDFKVLDSSAKIPSSLTNIVKNRVKKHEKKTLLMSLKGQFQRK